MNFKEQDTCDLRYIIENGGVKMKKYISILILGLFIIVSFIGCTEEAKENVIATVEGEEITEQDIKDRIEFLEISEKLYTGDEDAETDFTKNDAFNQMAREKVQYIEAKNLGYEVKTKEEIMEMFDESKDETDKVDPEIKENLNDKYGSKEEFEESILKEYAYDSMENYYKENVDMLIARYSINELSINYMDELEKELGKENNNDNLEYKEFFDSWVNYSEHLLKNADIEIKNDEYQIEYQGDKWEHEGLDLEKE
jgi:hypothetical protein